jgi:RNA polymerase sigma-70 factor (ECF subfamily)
MKSKQGKEKARSDSDQLFPNTHWSLVLRTRDESTVALNTLCKKYYKPLLIWLRCRQHKFRPLEAEDLLNGFLASKLRQHFLRNINPGKGKFRSFVLVCLDRYATDELQKCNAAIRGGGKPRPALEERDERGQAIIEPVSAEPGADEAYDMAWGHVILASAVCRLEAELASKGHLPLWEALQPHLYEEAEAPSYGQIAKELGISRNALYTVAHRIRKRLNALIREEVRETVASQEDFDEELNRFINLFSHSHRSGTVL